MVSAMSHTVTHCVLDVIARSVTLKARVSGRRDDLGTGHSAAAT